MRLTHTTILLELPDLAMSVDSCTRCGSTPHARAKARTTRSSLSSSRLVGEGHHEHSSEQRLALDERGRRIDLAGLRTRISSGASGGTRRRSAARRSAS